METLESPKLGFVDRIKAAAGVMTEGRLPNPLAAEPKEEDKGELVKMWTARLLKAREFWKPVFDRMKEEQEFAAGKQWPEDGANDWFKEKYVGDRIGQILNRMCATRYAKNPTANAVVRERMYYAIWDEDEKTLAGAKAILQDAQPILDQAAGAMAQGQVPTEYPPEAILQAKAIVEDEAQGTMRKKMDQAMARMARLLVQQQIETQTPDFIVEMKRLVTRVDVSRVGYVKVGYRRDETPMDPMQAEKMQGLQARLTALKTKLDRIAHGEVEVASAEADETQVLLEAVTKELSEMEKPEFEDEGPTDDFLTATSVLVDPDCRSLREFIGARWIAHEKVMEVADAEEEFGISLFDCGAVIYDDRGPQGGANTAMKFPMHNKQEFGPAQKVCVWEVQDKKTGTVFTLIDGVKHFIKPPEVRLPKVKRFWNIVALTYHVTEIERNDPQNDVTIYAKSTVRRAMPDQITINAQGEEFRATLIANRPRKVGVKSKFGDDDLRKLSAPAQSHDCILLNNLNDGEKIDDFIQEFPVSKIDPTLYNPGPQDYGLQMATGFQPADIGRQGAGETATGQAISQGNLLNVNDSQTADMDYFLGTIFQMHWEMSLQEMPAEVVERKIGPGAKGKWPDVAKDRFATDIFVEIEAGSSGKPNAALEAMKAEKIGPLIIQAVADPRLIPLVKFYARILGLDIDEVIQAIQQNPPAMMPPGGPMPGGMPSGPLAPGQPANNVVPPGGQARPQLPPQQRAQVAAVKV